MKMTVKNKHIMYENYVKGKEIERHLPGCYSLTSLKCTDDDDEKEYKMELSASTVAFIS